MTKNEAITIVDGQQKYADILMRRENIDNVFFEAQGIVLELAKKRYHDEQVKEMENIVYGRDKEEPKNG